MIDLRYLLNLSDNYLLFLHQEEMLTLMQQGWSFDLNDYLIIEQDGQYNGQNKCL